METGGSRAIPASSGRDEGVKRFAPELLNRMTLKPMGRVVKASMLSLAMALGVTACSNNYTVSYVYMTTSKTLPHGLINGYQVDYQSGFLRPLADSPVDAGGRDHRRVGGRPQQAVPVHGE